MLSFNRIFIWGASLLFMGIAVVGWMKQRQGDAHLSQEKRTGHGQISQTPVQEADPIRSLPVVDELSETEVDEVWRLFDTGEGRSLFVETVRYRSVVPWLEGRQAWVGDYASHYKTSRHLISRSINQKIDYESQGVSQGDRFNVFKLDLSLEFHLVVDLSRCKMWLYAFDRDGGRSYLFKTYQVGVGRIEDGELSNVLTPRGCYRLGSRVAIYRPGNQGYFRHEKLEMVQVFGTRWLPLVEVSSSAREENGPLKGYGFHGAPWRLDEATGEYLEDRGVIGTYTSDGCVRLLQQDIEELYAIVITKPTFVQIVTDFKEAQLPGEEATFGAPDMHEGKR